MAFDDCICTIREKEVPRGLDINNGEKTIMPSVLLDQLKQERYEFLGKIVDLEEIMSKIADEDAKKFIYELKTFFMKYDKRVVEVLQKVRQASPRVPLEKVEHNNYV